MLIIQWAIICYKEIVFIFQKEKSIPGQKLDWQESDDIQKYASLIWHSYIVLLLSLNIHKTTIDLLFKVKLTKNKLTGLA